MRNFYNSLSHFRKQEGEEIGDKKFSIRNNYDMINHYVSVVIYFSIIFLNVSVAHMKHRILSNFQLYIEDIMTNFVNFFSRFTMRRRREEHSRCKGKMVRIRRRGNSTTMVGMTIITIISSRMGKSSSIDTRSIL